MTVPLAQFLAVWAFFALNVLSPGPNVLNTITTAMGSGRFAGVTAAAAVALGVTAWCLLAALGFGALFSALPLARTGLTALAVLLLVWFASRYLRGAWAGLRGGTATLRGVQGLGAGQAFWRSLEVIALNPKALTTWLVIAGLFPVGVAGGGDIALLTLGAAVVAGGIHLVYALVFSTGPAARFYLRAAPWINGGVGLFFLGFAARLAGGLTG